MTARLAMSAVAALWLALLSASTAFAVAPETAAAQGQAVARLIKTPNREHVWTVRDGRRHWVPDLETFTTRGYRWDDVELVAPAVLREIPVGPADLAAPLLRDPSSGAIYLVTAGRLRHVPDPHTFAALGLTWDRVTTLDARAATPHGPPLPHAVSGYPLVVMDPARVPATTQIAPEPPATIQAALRLIEQYPPTADWPAFLRRYGVSVGYGDVPQGAVASYRAENRALTVGHAYAATDPRAIASVLVHETVHAILDAQGASGARGRACIDEEAVAFAMQAAFWALHRPAGAGPAAPGSLEAELDRVLAAAEDDALVATVITSWAYTLRCYFPSSARGGQGDD